MDLKRTIGKITYIGKLEKPTEKLTTIKVGIDTSITHKGRDFPDFIEFQAKNNDVNLFDHMEGDLLIIGEYKVGDKVMFDSTVGNYKLDSQKGTGDPIIYNNISLVRITHATRVHEDAQDYAIEAYNDAFDKKFAELIKSASGSGGTPPPVVFG